MTLYPLRIEDNKQLVWGTTSSGRVLQVVYLIDPDKAVFVIHARPLTEREKFRRRSARRKRGR